MDRNQTVVGVPDSVLGSLDPRVPATGAFPDSHVRILTTVPSLHSAVRHVGALQDSGHWSTFRPARNRAGWEVLYLPRRDT